MDIDASLTTRLRPALAAVDEPVVVNSNQQLQDAAAIWQQAPVLGLDTEFVRERTYRAALGLVQVSDGETAWLVDPLAIDDVSPLGQLLEDQATVKVIHSGSEDFEVLNHELGTQLNGVLDSQIACAMLGQSLQLGYHHAAQWLLGVEVEKDQTRSNWLRRPLSKDQHRYAALDVVLLPFMMERLRPQLEKLGRWAWLEEEVQRAIQKSVEDTNPQQAWMRIGGAGALNEQQRTSLAALAAWREQVAVQKNLARGFVVPDNGLMALARRQPATINEIGEIEAIHPKAARRYGDTWVELLQSSRDNDPAPPLPQLGPAQRRLMKLMKQRVAKISKELDVDAGLLASRKQLEELLFNYTENREIPERFTGWRSEVVTRHLIQILDESAASQ